MPEMILDHPTSYPTVNKKPSTLSLTTETPIINKGETVKVTGKTDATEATGNVTYKIGTRTIGTQPLNSTLEYISTETNNFIITENRSHHHTNQQQRKTGMNTAHLNIYKRNTDCQQYISNRNRQPFTS